MAGTRVTAKTPTQMLKQDHRTVKHLFAEYAKLAQGEEPEKDRLFEEIKAVLTIHSEIEERLFYPAVRDVGIQKSGDIVSEALEQHQIVKTLLEDMSRLDAGDEHFEAKMKVLRESVEHHANEEEKEMFPLERKLSKNVQESLQVEMESLRSDLEGEDEE